MARPLRIEFTGAMYHQTARGNAGADIFVGGATLAEIPLAQRFPAVRSLAEYQAGATHPREAMARAHASGAYSLAAIARHFGVHYSTVSRAVKRVEGGG